MIIFSSIYFALFGESVSGLHFSELNTKNWNNYFIPGTNVLKNNLGIIDKEELMKCKLELSWEGNDTSFFSVDN